MSQRPPFILRSGAVPERTHTYPNSDEPMAPSRAIGHGDELWTAAGRAVNVESSWDSAVVANWRAPGLYWNDSQGFLWRALRYAVATVYAYANAMESLPTFSEPCRVDKDAFRSAIDKNSWRVELAHHHDWSADSLSTGKGGYLSATRGAGQGDPWIGLTITAGLTTLSDVVQLYAAIADYYFWWGIRLYDYLKQGLAEDSLATALLSMCCARAGLAEIVQLAGFLVHEWSHTTGIPYTWAECAGVDIGSDGRLRCCHYNLEWAFVHRLTGIQALPLSLLFDLVNTSSNARPLDESWAQRDRFDFDAGEHWLKSSTNRLPSEDDCGGAVFAGEHHSLWAYRHQVDTAWTFPSRCASNGNNSGRASFGD